MAEWTHAPYDKLSRETITLHQAIRSLIEELDAMDWYRQRADDCTDAPLRAILLHNMREEIEHASMLLEWLRRNDSDFAARLSTYLHSAGEITTVEQAAEAGATSEPRHSWAPLRRFTIGPMK